MSASDLFFAYGTLRRNAPVSAQGAPREIVEALAQSHIGPARTHARLYRMDDYSALVPSKAAPADSPADRVVGDVYRIDEALWPVLDSYEGDAYVREMIWVTIENGQTLQATAYVARDPRALRARIESGDFFDAR